LDEIIKGAQILIADDEPVNVELVDSILRREGFKTLRAYGGEEVLEIVSRTKPDLILLDLLMPHVDGYQVLRRLKSDKEYRLIPIVVLTAFSEEKVQAFEAGADDFISKPIDRHELLARVKAHLRMKSYLSELEYAESILYALAQLVEARDSYTEEHTARVAAISVLIAEELGLKQIEIDALKKGALLHDIGKIGVPDCILLKRGPLSKREFEIMKLHTVTGFNICKKMKSLRGAIFAIRNHHEKWNGEGYPDRLKGKDIPLLARIVSVADAYDAMTTNRPYRDALTHKEALNELQKKSGEQWDPTIVEIALQVIPRLRE